MVLNEFNQEFINYKKSYCENDTIDFYINCLYKYISILDLSLFSDINYCFNKDNIIKFVELLRNENITNNSIKTYVRGIKVYFRYAYKNKYIQEDYTIYVKTPKKNNNLKLPLSNNEVQIIDEIILKNNDYISHRNYLIFHLMIDAGLRLGEVCHLKISDIDLNRNILFIHNSKNNKSRFVPLPNLLYYDLFKFVQFRKNIDAATDLLFLNKEFTDSISKGTVKQFMYKLKNKTGITRLHSHLLRHTYATSFIVYHNNIEYLRALLGHEDYSITKIYIQSATNCKLLKYDIYRVDNI